MTALIRERRSLRPRTDYVCAAACQEVHLAAGLRRRRAVGGLPLTAPPDAFSPYVFQIDSNRFVDGLTCLKAIVESCAGSPGTPTTTAPNTFRGHP